MRGKTDEEILKERKALIADVRMKTHEEIEVIESFFEGAPGWQDYRGCRIEHDAATQYGIPIVEV